MHDEELGTCGVRVHRTRHGENALGVLEIVRKTILAELTLDGIPWTAHTISIRASALNHKALDDTVKDQTIIKALLDQADKVVDCVRRNLWVELCLHDITIFHLNGNNWIFHVCFLLNFKKYLIKWSHYTIKTFENRPFFVPYLSIFFTFRKFLLTIHSHLWLKMYSTMSKWTFYAKR